jgi:hypothetical protein
VRGVASGLCVGGLSQMDMVRICTRGFGMRYSCMARLPAPCPSLFPYTSRSDIDARGVRTCSCKKCRLATSAPCDCYAHVKSMSMACNGGERPMPDATHRAHRAMRPRTFRLDPEADDYLQSLCPRRTGGGAIVSRLLLEHRLRAELAGQYSTIASREQWDEGHEAGLEAID